MNKKKHTYSKAWEVVYAVHPPIRKVMQIGGRHEARGPYLLGKLNTTKYTLDAFKEYLISINFERARLAFKEEGEVLNMRRVDGLKFQWHLRVFEDWEVRAHYEPAPENSPIKHLKDVFKHKFKDDKDFLKSLLGDYIS